VGINVEASKEHVVRWAAVVRAASQPENLSRLDEAEKELLNLIAKKVEALSKGNSEGINSKP
jgi:hypothetical protein